MKCYRVEGYIHPRSTIQSGKLDVEMSNQENENG